MRKILYISLLDWYFTKQRPQHLAGLLSEKYKIKYLCSKSWSTKDIKKHHEEDKLLNMFSVNENLRVHRIKLLPLQRLKIIDNINNTILKFIVKSQMKRDNPDIIWVTHPNHLDLIPNNYSEILVYDCMDNYSKFSTKDSIQQKIIEKEKRLCEIADYIFTSSNGLNHRVSKYIDSDKVVTVKNGTAFEHFNGYYNSDTKKNIPTDIPSDKKVIGYFGGISSWFDVELIEKIALKFNNCNIIIIGPINNALLRERAKLYENLILLGPREYSDLPKYLYNFDICIMPFLINDLIRDVNPVKLYEYLSMGKPVVAPYYEEISEFQEVVLLAKDHDDFLSKIKSSLTNGDKLSSNNRIRFARNNSWASRIEAIDSILNAKN